jgi:short-subunit dehydrogenase
MTGQREVAVVTGASRGLGLLLARELGGRGMDLVICARTEDTLAGAAAELRTTGVEVVTVAADVGEQAGVTRVIDTATHRFGRLDVLVNNAGVIQVGPVAALRADEFDQALRTMLWSVVHAGLAALPVMRDQGHGRIVNISSIGGKFPAPHLLPYVTAKHAVTGFSEGLRAEVAKYGISVTTVVPGLMRTGSPRNALFAGDRAAEYRWFTLADSLPLLSMDAERAARRIVSGALRGRAEIVLTPAARLAVAAHGIAPGLTTRLAGLADRLLPRDETADGPAPGHTTEDSQPRWFAAATRLTRRAAHRLRQQQG